MKLLALSGVIERDDPRLRDLTINNIIVIAEEVKVEQGCDACIHLDVFSDSTGHEAMHAYCTLHKEYLGWWPENEKIGQGCEEWVLDPDDSNFEYKITSEN